MSLPYVRVEIGFTGPYLGTVFTIGDATNGRVGSVPIGEGNSWVDVSPYVRSWQIRRGTGQANSPTRRYDPGTATVVFNDGDRRFDPDNLAGPYVDDGVSMIQPMRRVRITAIWADVAYVLFTGYADDWVPDYQHNVWTYTTLTATDAHKVWAAADRTAVAPVGAGELTGARIDRILTSFGWPTGDRVLDAGNTTVQATELTGGALTELQLVQDSEQGDLFVDENGKAVFLDRASVFTRPESLDSQVIFGDGGYEDPIEYEFTGGVGHFTAFNGTAVQSSTFTLLYPQSLLMTVTGTPTQTYARPTYGTPVEEGREYTATMWVYRPVAGNVVCAIDWFDDDDNYIGGVYVTTAVSAGVWAELTATGTADPGTTRARIGPTLAGSPATGTQLYLNTMTFEPGRQEIPYADVKLTSLSDNLANRVTIGRVGGAPQTVSDATSISAYLVRGYERTDLLMDSDSEALTRAQALLFQYKDATRQIARVEFNRPRIGVEAAFWPAVLARTFGDRVTVVRRPAGGGDAIERDVLVRGIEHASDGSNWSVAFVMQSASPFSYFTIGHPDRGRIGAYPVAF